MLCKVTVSLHQPTLTDRERLQADLLASELAQNVHHTSNQTIGDYVKCEDAAYLFNSIQTLSGIHPHTSWQVAFISAASEPTSDVLEDAARWRALLACERIRVVGSARLGEPSGHLGLELWGRYPDGPHPDNQHILTQFVDGLRS